MHPLEQSKPDSSHVAKLLKESSTHPINDDFFEEEVEENEVFYGLIYENRGSSEAIDIRTKDGNHKGFYFGEITRPEYNPSDGIRFRSPTQRVHIQGKNLKKIYQYILQYQLKWIKEKDSSVIVSDAKTPIITKITIEEAG